MLRALFNRRERRSLLVSIPIALGCLLFIWTNYTAPSFISSPDVLHRNPKQGGGADKPGRFGPLKGSEATDKLDPHEDNQALLPGTRLQATDLETTAPTVPFKLDSNVEVRAGTWGFNVLDKLYLRNGTFYIVTNDPKTVPTKKEIMHRLGRFSTQGDEDDEGSELIQYITPAESKAILGDVATVLPGVTFLILDPPRYLTHFYHYWGEVILGAWRVYSTLALSKDPTVLNTLPFPSRFLLPFVDNDEWRDRADINGPFMRLAFPDASMDKGDVWRDWIKVGGTQVFERAVTVNRVSAHKSPLGSVWFKMISSTQNITSPRHFWEPIRRSVTKGLFGHAPTVGKDGKPVSPPQFGPSKSGAGVDSTLPVVTYISRQSTGRRLLTPDHEALVDALQGLEREGLCTVRIPVMEDLNLKQQIAEIASSTIIVGVHGNGLTHQMFMPPSLRSAVLEIQVPGSYAFDYWMLARNMGHKHYMIRNDTVTTFGPNEWHKGVLFGKGFHGSTIPVSSVVVADLIRLRLTQPEESVEE